MNNPELSLSPPLQQAINPECAKFTDPTLTEEEITLQAFMNLRRDKPEVFDPLNPADAIAWQFAEPIPGYEDVTPSE